MIVLHVFHHQMHLVDVLCYCKYRSLLIFVDIALNPPQEYQSHRVMGFQSTCSVAHGNTMHPLVLFHTQSATTVSVGVVTYCRVDNMVESETRSRHNQHVTVQHFQLLNDTTDIITCS